MKKIVLGVSSSIAIYKACEILQKLKYLECDVSVVMTKNATELIKPRLFEELSGNPVYVDMWDYKKRAGVEHIELAKRDLFLIAPATARVIGSIANGLCDDMLTTSVIATKSPVIIAPAMNTNMWENPAVQYNLQKLHEYGYHFVDPVEKMLACGDIGKGGLASPNDIVAVVKNFLV